MRALRALSILAVAAASAFAGSAREEATRDFDKTLSLPSGRSLRVVHKLGDVVVRGHASPEVRVHARIRASAETLEQAKDVLGRIQVEQGRVQAARQAYAEALPLFQELGYLRGIARSVAGFAQIALAEGDPRRAAKLLAGIEFLLERSGDDLPPDDGAFVRTLETTARERLRKPAFSTSWAEGSSLSADALVALAVAEEPPEKRQALG